MVKGPSLGPRLSCSVRLGCILGDGCMFNLFAGVRPSGVRRVACRHRSRLESMFRAIGVSVCGVCKTITIVPFEPFSFVDSELALVNYTVRGGKALCSIFFSHGGLFNQTRLGGAFCLARSQGLLLRLQNCYVSPIVRKLCSISLVCGISTNLA